MAPFEPLEQASLKFLTLKTVLLVSIRINELQALSNREPFFRGFQDRNVLRTDPGFLPKVASAFHRTQEIILPTFCQYLRAQGRKSFIPWMSDNVF